VSDFWEQRGRETLILGGRRFTVVAYTEDGEAAYVVRTGEFSTYGGLVTPCEIRMVDLNTALSPTSRSPGDEPDQPPLLGSARGSPRWSGRQVVHSRPLDTWEDSSP